MDGTTGKAAFLPGRWNITLTILKSALELISKNPARKVKMPAGESEEVPPFSLDQMKRIFEALKGELL